MNIKKIVFYCAMECGVVAAMAENPLWMRNSRISPDGKQIAFCYKGDIYKVSAAGGEAVRLTTEDCYETAPVWSPDGSLLAFASDRNGNMDVYVMSSEGGPARCLTTHSTSEKPVAFTPDGKQVLFSACIQDPVSSALFPSTLMSELYQVPVGGGRPEQLLATPAVTVCYNAAGDGFLYQDRKGFEDTFRKHHTSSVTRDVWFYDAKTRKHRNLTTRGGEDLEPVFGPDSKQVYFLSERGGGSMNVYSFPFEQPDKVVPVTTFQKHPVRYLSISRTGVLCYTYDGRLYTQAQGAKPVPLEVRLPGRNAPDVAHLQYSSGATGATVSPDGKQIAFTVRGEVFVTSVDYPTTKQITHTPEAESGLSFGADGRSLVYASERGGNWQLVMARIRRDEEPNFANATLVDEEILLPSARIERMHPTFSPDGTEIAFIEDRTKLMVMDVKTKKVRQITDGSQWYGTGGGFDYAWSPDGKWFTLEFCGNHHDPYNDIGLVSADGGGKIINLTQSGYMSGSPRWVLGGNAILFHTERYGMRNHASWGSENDVMMVFLNRKSYDEFRMSEEERALAKELEKKEKEGKQKQPDKKAKKPSEKDSVSGADKKELVTVEPEGIEERIVRLTPNSSSLGSSIISGDGQYLFYLSAFEGGFDLWRTDLYKHETRLLHKMNTSWSAFETDKSGKTLFILNGGRMQKMDMPGGSLTSISYQAEFDLDRAAERTAMFEHVYRQIKKRFYVTNLHGTDWDGLKTAYQKFLPHIENNYDFAELLSEWLGELNVSHTGGRYRPSSRGGDATAQLGLLFDTDYKGEGLRVGEVLVGGPFDKAASKVKAGTVLEKIDGVRIEAGMDYFPLLNHKAGKKMLVSLRNPDSGDRWEEVVKPSGSVSLYQRWVKQRAADVDKWSNGRLGYVHIPSMADASFRTVYSDILGKYNDREGIVIDIRFNGGGRLHEDVEVLFSGKKYFQQVIRGRRACDMPSRRWNKPSVMVTCEADYSNAHGTPWVYQHQGIGRVVGMPVAGTMTSVSWETLQDPSLVFGIPIIGYELPDGSYLENTQLEPDVKVTNDPETIVGGEDRQLKRAVEELLKELDKAS